MTDSEKARNVAAATADNQRARDRGAEVSEASRQYAAMQHDATGLAVAALYDRVAALEARIAALELAQRAQAERAPENPVFEEAWNRGCIAVGSTAVAGSNIDLCMREILDLKKRVAALEAEPTDEEIAWAQDVDALALARRLDKAEADLATARETAWSNAAKLADEILAREIAEAEFQKLLDEQRLVWGALGFDKPWKVTAKEVANKARSLRGPFGWFLRIRAALGEPRKDEEGK